MLVDILGVGSFKKNGDILLPSYPIISKKFHTGTRNVSQGYGKYK